MKYLFSITLLFLMGCSSSKAFGPQNVIVTLSGFDVTTPSGWHIVNGSRRGPILNKYSDKEISEVGWALTGDTPKNLTGIQALNWIKTEKIADANRNRMSGITNNFTLIKFNGLYCLKYIQSSQDKKTDMMLSAIGLTCLHPKLTYHYVDLSLSQRHKLGATPLNHSSDFENFYRTLKSTEKLFDP